MRIGIDRFYGDIGFTGRGWEDIEEALRRGWDRVSAAWETALAAEAEAHVHLLDTRVPSGYTDAYIDAQLLANTGLLRYVKRRYTRREDVEYYILVLGEITAAPPSPGGHDHGRGGRAGARGFGVEWIMDMVDYLEITREEMMEYERLVAENAERISVLAESPVEDARFLAILKGWEEKTFLKNIVKMIAAVVEGGEAYLAYIEDHQMGNEITSYVFLIARLAAGEK